MRRGFVSARPGVVRKNCLGRVACRWAATAAPLVAAVALPPVVCADNWINPAGGSWMDGTNWSTGTR